MGVTTEEELGVKIKTIPNLPNSILDYITASILNLKPCLNDKKPECFICINDRYIKFSPTSQWFNCGPLLERFRIGLEPNYDPRIDKKWYAYSSHENNLSHIAYSDNPLRAITEAFIASKNGSISIDFNVLKINRMSISQPRVQGNET